MERTEYTTEQDLFFNYCLWEYRPDVPFAGKLRSSNLLYSSFACAGADGRMFDLVRAIRGGIGEGMSVWGVKHAKGRIGWEFYFYDYRRRERTRSATRVLKAIHPLVRSSLAVNENLHYYMFSLDIRDELLSGAADLDEIHLYIGNPGSAVSSGICYSLSPEGTRLENFYFFFDPRQHRDDVIAKIRCSAHIDSSAVDIDRILWPELRECRTICLANKQRSDCIYFSGIRVDQLIFFLEKMNYPSGIRSFVEGNRPALDHLLYDVGFDYRMDGGRLVIEKSGYYGTF